MTREATRARVGAVVVATVAMTLGLALRDVVGVWLATGLGAAVAAMAVVAVDAKQLRAWLSVTRGTLLVGLAAGLAMAVATHLVYAPVAEAFPVVEREVRGLYAVIDAPPGRIAALPILALVIGAEEIVWRGEVMDLLRPRVSAPTAVVVASLLYVIPQVGIGSWLLAAVALGCGLLWSALRVCTGSVTAPLVAHLVWDVVVFVLFPVL